MAEKKQFWQIYHKIPEDLKEALFSKETENLIENIYQKYQIKDGELSVLVDLINEVLTGGLSFNKFPSYLKEKTELSFELVEEISKEINRFLFFPLQDSLNKIYGADIYNIKPSEEINKINKKTKNKINIDQYRESVE